MCGLSAFYRGNSNIFHSGSRLWQYNKQQSCTNIDFLTFNSLPQQLNTWILINRYTSFWDVIITLLHQERHKDTVFGQTCSAIVINNLAITPWVHAKDIEWATNVWVRASLDIETSKAQPLNKLNQNLMGDWHRLIRNKGIYLDVIEGLCGGCFHNKGMEKEH